MDRLTRLLALHRRPNERLQAPSGRLTSSFTITHPGEPKDVPIYLSCEDAALWTGASITLSLKDGREVSLRPAAKEPFAVARLPPLTKLTATMMGTSEVMPVTLTLRGSAAFVEFRRQPAVTSDIALPKGTVLLDGRGFGGPNAGATFDFGIDYRGLPTRSQAVPPVLVVIVRGPGLAAPSVTLEILPADRGSIWTETRMVAFNGMLEFAPPPGSYVVNAHAPGAEPKSEQVVIQAGHCVTVEIAFPGSPHEWLVAATIMGLIDADLPAETDSMPTIEVAGQGFKVGLDLSTDPIAGALFDVPEVAADARFSRRDIAFVRRHRWGLAFLSVRSGDRAELAVVPHTLETSAGDSGWSVQLLAKRPSGRGSPMAHVVVESHDWMSLLGYLTRRDFVSAKALLDGSDYMRAFKEKRLNPIAATAAALVAVSLADPAQDAFWDDWLENLSEMFPDLPDGPIIWGRRLLTRARGAAEIDKARRLLMEGFDRGAPVFSLSADWLARSLESLPGEDADLIARRATARRFVQRVDPQQPFTVIRVR